MTFLNKILHKQLLIGLTVGLILAGVAGYAYYAYASSSWLTVKDIEIKSTEFVNSELLQGKGSATVKVLGKEGNLYKLEVTYNGQKIESFVTKDGKRFFPQSIEMIKNNVVENKENATANSNPVVSTVEQKSDKPVVELFVMSHCPYGLQMEKGILPVVKTLGDKIDFNIKFTDYAMHGEKELKEQLNQYCIQKEQPAKFLSYLECFSRDGESGGETCLSQAGIDKTKLSSCFARSDKEFKVLENFKNKDGYRGNYPGFEIFKADNEKYGVQGSPTLVINGTQSQSGRDSNSILKSICSAFNNPPKECSTELPSETPSPGFGGGVASAGSASSNAGCH